MLLPIRAKNPPENLPAVTVILIALNTIIYAATSNGWEIREKILDEWGLKSSRFDLAHMFSSMFLHANLLHLLGNMFFLYLFGFAVEGRLKSLKFTILYFAAGLAGDVLHNFLVGMAHPDMPSIGASGAIMGVMGAAMVMFPFGQVTVFYWISWFWRGTFDCPMWGVGLWYFFGDIFWAALSMHDGVGHFAHIGGVLAGALLCFLYRPTRDTRLASEAKATLSEAKELRYLSRLELSELHKMQPDDTAIVMNWMHRSAREPGGIRDECRDAFMRLLPRMMQEQDIRSVATCVGMVPTDDIAPNHLMHMATELERVGDHGAANRFYDLITKHPKASPDDLQASAFRTAMLAESVYKDPQRAVAWYGYILQTWPMGPFASQAQARLAVLQKIGQAKP